LLGAKAVITETRRLSAISWIFDFSEIKTPAPACFGNLAEKAAPPAPFGDCFF
jgi:hypothetical protein